LVTVLGASVYEPGEALEALRDADIGHLQIPLSVLDHRWGLSGVPAAMAERPSVVMHARSPLLQGLLVSEAPIWPQATGFDVNHCVTRLRELAKEFDRRNVADLCLAYVRAQNWVTSVVVGCETLEQLDENLHLFREPKLTLAQCQQVEEALPAAPEALLNPSRWTMKHDPALAQRP
jgi:spore coat polysaccharide biosynthesis protein SpsF